jgi:hypothetical protein
MIARREELISYHSYRLRKAKGGKEKKLQRSKEDCADARGKERGKTVRKGLQATQVLEESCRKVRQRKRVVMDSEGEEREQDTTHLIPSLG